MLKNSIISVIAIVIVSTAFATDPHIKTVVKNWEQGEKKYIKTDRNIFFKNGRIWYLTYNEKGKKELVSKYFKMGLDFGRPVGSNGSWSIWNFFKCYVIINGKYKNVPEMFLPENVYISQVDGATLAEILFPLSADGKMGKMSMRIMQFPSHNNWLFIQVKFINTAIMPKRLSFNAYPGNANNPKERERWIGTKENEYCLGKENVMFKPESNGLVMYSKFVHENSGNFFIFEASKFSKGYLPGNGANVSITLFPKEGEKEFKFGLGYFLNKSTADELPRFLGETQDSVYNFMENINWAPKPNSNEFDKLCTDTAKLIKDMASMSMGADIKKFETELNNIKMAFQIAVKTNDMNKASAQLELLKKLKVKISKAAMAQFN
jgi:hypothetical protein